jgi:hypothetical protein
LHAVKQSGVTIQTELFEDCDTASIRFVDQGKNRTTANQLNILGITPHGKTGLLAQMARAMLAGLRYSLNSISTDIQLRCIQKYGTQMAWVIDNAGTGLRRAPAYAVVTKAVILEGETKMEEFCHAIRDNVFKKPTEPANMLYRWLNRPTRATYKFYDVYGKTVTAVRAYLQGRTFRSLLSTSATDIGLEDLLGEFTPTDERNEDTAD